MDSKYKKVIVSGNVIEIYEMEHAPYTGDKNGDPKDNYNALDIPLSLEETLDSNYRNMMSQSKDRTEERRKQTARDSRNRVRRLTLANFDQTSKFITLTFKRNQIDIDEANGVFRKFMRYLRKHVKKLKYISVIEFQERKAVHYHMICNIPYVPHKRLLEYWHKSGADGSVNIQAIHQVDNVGAYIVAYMMKNAGDDRLKGRKMYLSSQGLEKPKEYKGDSADLVIETYLKDKKEVFTNSYANEYLGKITYKEYNLMR